VVMKVGVAATEVDTGVEEATENITEVATVKDTNPRNLQSNLSSIYIPKSNYPSLTHHYY